MKKTWLDTVGRAIIEEVKAKTDNLPSDPSSQAISNDKHDITHEHVHGREIWFGKSADQSGDNWGTIASLTPYRVISGNGDWGGDPNDEAKVLGPADTPFTAGRKTLDFHRLTGEDMDQTSIYVIRIIWGTGTMAEAIAAEQWSLAYLISDISRNALAGGAPLAIQSPRIAVGSKVWIQCKNATDNAYIDFFVGIHEYVQEPK